MITGEAGGTGLSAMLFGGQGGQRAGMGRELRSRFGVFAAALGEVTAALDPLLERPLADVLFAEPGTPEAAWLDQTGWAQPALFAVEVALSRLLSSFGVQPDLVLGHSVGEIAAAHVAGILALPDAARLVAARARLMQAMRPGVMISLRATEEEVAPLLDGRGAEISLAAVNGPSSVVIGGEPAAVLDVAAQFEARGRKVRRLRVSHAFHSPLMEPMLAEFRAVARELTYAPPAIPMVSTLTGRRLDPAELGSPTARPTARPTDGPTTGPRRCAAASASPTASAACGSSARPPSSRSGRTRRFPRSSTRISERSPRWDASRCCAPTGTRNGRVATALATLHVRGAKVDWAAFFADRGARPVELPTYAFQRSAYWPQRPAAAAATPGDPPDSALWDAVDREDSAELAALLGLAGQQHAALAELLPALSSWRQRRHDFALLDSARYRVQWRPVPPPAAPVLDGTWLMVTAEGIADDEIIAAVRGHGAVLRRLVLDRSGLDRAAMVDRLREEAGDLSGIVSLLPLADAPSALPTRRSALPTRPSALPTRPSALPSRPSASPTRPSALPSRPSASTLRARCRPAGRPGAERAARPGAGRRRRGCPGVDADPRRGVNRGGRPAGQPRPGGGMGTEPDRRAGAAPPLERPDRPAAAAFPAHRAAVWSASWPPRTAKTRWPCGTPASWAAASPVTTRASCRPAEAFRTRGTVLVTGGTGGLGAEVARWLARGGAARLLLTSRRGPGAPGAAALSDELTDLGAQVSIVACDVADADALAAVLAGIPAATPLTGVVHAAGVGQASSVTQTPLAAVAELTAAKMAGAANLDELLADRELDFFVLFASIAGIWGSAGQGAYGAANAYLDALAQYRRARGRAATSVAWGPWAEAGLAAGQEIADGLRRRGLRLLSPDTALAELRRAVVQGDVCVTVADVDWERFLPVFTAARPSALFAELPEAQASTLASPPEGGAGVRVRRPAARPVRGRRRPAARRPGAGRSGRGARARLRRGGRRPGRRSATRASTR